MTKALVFDDLTSNEKIVYAVLHEALQNSVLSKPSRQQVRVLQALERHIEIGIIKEVPYSQPRPPAFPVSGKREGEMLEKR